MRSAQRDQGGLMMFGAAVTDAASGSGVAQPGAIPFTFVRTGAGTYDLRYDGRLTPLVVLASAVDPGNTSNYANGYASGPGSSRVMTRAAGSATPTNNNFQFQITARDQRA